MCPPPIYIKEWVEDALAPFHLYDSGTYRTLFARKLNYKAEKR
jgi:hypothetical protein